MCVIALAESQPLTPDQVTSMFIANNSGAGIAWREEREGVMGVRWKKGLDLEEILYETAHTPLPYVAHFRIPTCGPRIGTSKSFFEPLTHPFPISIDVPLDLEGWTSNPDGVMFHNGIWSPWESQLKTLALSGRRLPAGVWSDSRAMAWCAAHLGLGILDLIDEKAIVFGPHEIGIVARGWTFTENILVSNESWQRRASFQRGSSGSSASTEKEEPQKGYHSPNNNPPRGWKYVNGHSGPLAKDTDDTEFWDHHGLARVDRPLHS